MEGVSGKKIPQVKAIELVYDEVKLVWSDIAEIHLKIKTQPWFYIITWRPLTGKLICIIQ